MVLLSGGTSSHAPARNQTGGPGSRSGRRGTIPAVLATLGIHHLGVAVHDAEAAAERYRALLGAEIDHRDAVAEQGVRAVAMRVGDGPMVELLSPLGEDTPVGRFLAKRGEGMHHVAYQVEGIQGWLERLAGDGVELIDTRPRQGLFGMQVAFIHPESVFGVLVELVEPHGGTR
jgi:methylmalonyl-CoA/ethylmalonyl-CoA epimerase